jgi:hypothetical protein
VEIHVLLYWMYAVCCVLTSYLQVVFKVLVFLLQLPYAVALISFEGFWKVLVFWMILYLPNRVSQLVIWIDLTPL